MKFADVAGVDEAKEELAEVVEFLKEPEKFSRLGARPPTGVLLVRPFVRETEKEGVKHIHRNMFY